MKADLTVKLIKGLTLEQIPSGADEKGHLIFKPNPREIEGEPNPDFKSSYILWDSNREAPPGFAIRVAAKKTYVLRRKVHGKSIMPTVGNFADFNRIELARARAADLARTLVETGMNPNELARKAASSEITLREVFARLPSPQSPGADSAPEANAEPEAAPSDGLARSEAAPLGEEIEVRSRVDGGALEDMPAGDASEFGRRGRSGCESRRGGRGGSGSPSGSARGGRGPGQASQELAMSADAVASAFQAAVARSKAREEWSTVVRNIPRVIRGVECNVHVKVQVFWQRVGANARVTGECFVYASARFGATLAGGSGWVHFAMSEAAVAGADRLFDVACAEACRELVAYPEFQARSESCEIADAVPLPRPAAAPRRRRL